MFPSEDEKEENGSPFLSLSVDFFFLSFLRYFIAILFYCIDQYDVFLNVLFLSFFFHVCDLTNFLLNNRPAPPMIVCCRSPLVVR